MADVITPFHERGYPGEWCKRCDRRVAIGFSVADVVWDAVVGRDCVVCAPCFDEAAERAGVRYRFLATWPVSWSDWIDDEAAA